MNPAKHTRRMCLHNHHTLCLCYSIRSRPPPFRARFNNRFLNVCRLRIIKTRTKRGRPGTEAICVTCMKLFCYSTCPHNYMDTHLVYNHTYIYIHNIQSQSTAKTEVNQLLLTQQLIKHSQCCCFSGFYSGISVIHPGDGWGCNTLGL